MPHRTAAHRSDSRRLPLEAQEPRRVRIHVDDAIVEAREGETVGAALMAEGVRVLRQTARRGDARGLFCGMGVCFDCLMEIDGRPNVQACLVPVADGMRVRTQQGPGEWGRE